MARTEYATELTKVSDSITCTMVELVRELNTKGHHEAATCVAELADHTRRNLHAAGTLAGVYL